MTAFRLRPYQQQAKDALWNALRLPYVEVANWLSKGHDLSDALCERMRGDVGLGAP